MVKVKWPQTACYAVLIGSFLLGLHVFNKPEVIPPPPPVIVEPEPEHVPPAVVTPDPPKVPPHKVPPHVKYPHRYEKVCSRVPEIAYKYPPAKVLEVAWSKGATPAQIRVLKYCTGD